MPPNTDYKPVSPEELAASFSNELQRLIAAGLSPEDEIIARRYYSDKERQSMDVSDFCGPHRSFPVKSQEDVNNAARLIGHADNPDAVKACIKRKAKANGWSLPKAWEDGDKKEREAEASDERSLEPSITPHLYLPIVRVDDSTWTVTGQATVEDEDAYGTVFDYEASKRAFQAWRGNVREMHDSKKAVGKAIDLAFDDANKAIYVTTRVSRGAADTWQKIKDGVLTGYSVGALAGKDDWATAERGGKTIPLLKNYKLVELSLVDHPATPGCNIEIVRADGFANGEVLAEDEIQANVEPTEERAGAKISHVTQSTLHNTRDGMLQHARNMMKLCADDGCEECQAGMAALDPDGDGDIDLVPSLDYDRDGGKHDMTADWRNLEPAIKLALAPTVQRFNAMLATLASQKPASMPQPLNIDTTAIERRLDTIEQLVPGIAEVRSLLSEVKELAERIAAQPTGGGPIASGAAMDKLLATQQGNAQPMSDQAVIARAAQLGLLNNQNSQILGATAQIREIMQQAGR
jgi:HK97 family phage prohead protease